MREAVFFEVLLDLRKAYNVLDWERALDLLTLYEVGTRTFQLLRKYWYQLTMVAKAGGYFMHPFKGYRCVIQEYPLYPKIFNVVVYYVIRHWVIVVTPNEAGMVGIGLTIIDLEPYFYDDDSLVAST